MKKKRKNKDNKCKGNIKGAAKLTPSQGHNSTPVGATTDNETPMPVEDPLDAKSVEDLPQESAVGG